MCIAIPAQVVDLEGDYATVQSKGNQFLVHRGLIEVQRGDYVLVHAGCAIQVINEKEAISLEQLFCEVEEASHE